MRKTATAMVPETSTKRCELASCGREFMPPADAPHKRFCCDPHRQTWHHLRRKKAMDLLRAAEGGKPLNKSAEDLGL